jgi:DNA-binding CsgD family transcriptional regulator
MEALPPDTKQQLQTSGLKRLSPTEREQLQEYIESVKTIKKEIAKLAAKAGKKVREEGGDTTGLMMGPQVTSEAASKSEIEDIESKISDKLYSAAERVIKHLMRANLSPKQIKKFLNHEVEEMAQKKSSEKHDKVEEAKWMGSTGYPKNRNKFGNQNMKLKVVPNPNAGKYRIVSLSKSGGVLDNRFFDTEEEANEVMRGMSLSGGAKVVKLPDTMTVYTT